MRITNTMTVNKLLVNINRNVTTIDKLMTQYTSGKKIQFPSDDPIIAARALKFRTNVTQTDQYIRNTQQGLSWMNITEEGFNNILEGLHKIGELSNEGATSTLEYSDRQKIAATIRAYAEQLGAEMNITYAGRYVFSGFRTDEPPIIEKTLAGSAGTNEVGSFDLTFTTAPGDTLPLGTVGTPGSGVLGMFDNLPPAAGLTPTAPPYLYNGFAVDYTSTQTVDPVTNEQTTTVTITPATGTMTTSVPNPALTPTVPATKASVAAEYGITVSGGKYVYNGVNFDDFTFNATTGDITALTPSAMKTLDANSASETITSTGGFGVKGSVGNIALNASVPATGTDYNITQYFNFNDIEKVKVYQIVDGSDEPEVYEVYRLKLPYVGNASTTNNTLQLNSVSWSDALGVNPTWSADANDGTRYKTTGVDPNPSEVYRPDDTGKDVHFIPETGEIILSEAYVEALRNGRAQEIKVEYTKAGLAKGDLNPRVYFDCVDNENKLSFNMNNEEMTFEFGTNTRIRINSLAKDVFTPQLYADLMRLCDDIEGIEMTSDVRLAAKYSEANFPPPQYSEADRQEMITEQKRAEAQKYNGVMQSMFNSMLGLAEKHLSVASKEDTALGSRMTRLGLIQDRLKTDYVSYTALMSENEDVDYLDVLMNLSAAQNVYTASLKAGASISQMSLADFI